ncbi:unnamed protein product [Peniophora sp. CBMAI 1063]|nr:unnamed protein product [Peniophora sp. CBMAI 1063]
MSKSSTASNSKLPPQLPQKSAWARGPPPTTTSRSQSPAPSTPTTPNAPGPAVHGTHSRRPSTLGQGASVKEGVSIPRNAPAAAKAGGSGVTFGSIDNAGAPISSSPATAPAVKSGDVTKFGSVSVNGEAAKSVITSRSQAPSASSSTAASTASTPATTAPTSTPSPAPKLNKRDISKLFQGPSVTAAAHTSTPSPAESTASPASRQSGLPHVNAPPFVPPPFTPGGGLRTGSNGTPPGGPPRSPSYSRPPMANGQNGNVPGRPPSGPNPAIPQAMPSPRMGQHPPPGPPQGMPQMAPWGPYYAYSYGMPPPQPGTEGMYPYPQPPTWGMPPQGMPPHHQPQPGAPPQGMPMSPHKPPSALQTPSTPTLAHASPVSQHPPPPQPNVTSPPPTPSTSNSSRLNGTASAFVPKKTISLKSADGKPVDLDNLRRNVGPSPVSAGPQSPSVGKIEHTRTPSRPVVRMETPEQKKAREAAEEEKAKKEREAKEKEERAKKEAAEKREREEREKKEAEEKAKREAEEKVKKEKEEAERKAKEEAEAAERAKKEEEERKRKEEEEAAAKAKAEEEAKAKEAAEKKAAEEASAAKAKADEEAKAKAAAEPAETEEGEIVEDKEKKADDKSGALRIETALPSPEARRRPGPLNLKDVGKNIPQPLPSALATARIIDDISSIAYPEGIQSPKLELNVNASKGKFKYDRDFLLQFMAVCKDKPDNLPPLDAIGLEPSDQAFSMARGGSGRRASGMQTPSSRSNPIGLGFGPIGKAGMGNFAMPAGAASKLSSEERFAMASRSASTSGAGMPRAGAPPLSRTSSQGGPGGDRRRTRSSRGHARDNNRQSTIQQPPSNMQPPLEPVAPLEQTANRWTPMSTKRNAQVDMDSPEVVDRKVKALLNKLTMERFDSISDQIIEWANKSEKEKDGRTLIQVIRLVFEKATDEATFSEMYARLCRKMMEQISTKVQDDGILNNEGKPFAGGQLFRKYLLNRCQEDFERGWAAKDAAAAAAAAKASEDAAVKEAVDKAKEGGKVGEDGEFELYSDEYYAAAKAKRRGLGLIRFIGELFKLQMLTERIMHECIKKLLGNVENPEEEEIESLCKLLATVGSIIDTPKARAHMDVYFSRMKELAKSKNVNSRMTFMLQDVIELRENKWQPRNKVAAPTTLSQIHDQAAKEKAAQDSHAAMARNNPMTRGGSRRGDNRNDGPVIGPDGWAIAGSGSGAPRAPPKAGDLSKFGQINKQQPMTFGPSGVFAKGKKDGAGSVREGSMSRTASVSRNMFDMLSGADAPEAPVATKSSRPPSRKPSVDLSQAGASETPMQRRKLNLLPRSKPLEEAPKPEEEGTEDGEEAEEEAGPSMSEEEAKRKIGEDVKELFLLRSLDEAESYFTSLPAEHRALLVDTICMKGIDSKAADVQLITDLLTRANEKSLASLDAFEKGLEQLAELVDDIAIDVPKAFDIFADWLRASGLAADEERKTRIAEKLPEGKDKLLGLLA